MGGIVFVESIEKKHEQSKDDYNHSLVSTLNI